MPVFTMLLLPFWLQSSEGSTKSIWESSCCHCRSCACCQPSCNSHCHPQHPVSCTTIPFHSAVLHTPGNPPHCLWYGICSFDLKENFHQHFSSSSYIYNLQPQIQTTTTSTSYSCYHNTSPKSRVSSHKLKMGFLLCLAKIKAKFRNSASPDKNKTPLQTQPTKKVLKAPQNYFLHWQSNQRVYWVNFFPPPSSDYLGNRSNQTHSMRSRTRHHPPDKHQIHTKQTFPHPKMHMGIHNRQPKKE